MPRPERIYVVSDLHLGRNDETCIFHAGEALAKFINTCATQPGRVELVILGDALDFLQIAPELDLRPGPAVDKVRDILAANKPVFAALAGFCAQNDKSLVWVIGNHDLELVFPTVRAEIATTLGDPPQLSWVLDERGWAYDLPGNREIRLIHGNKYDSYNNVDYQELAAVAARGGDKDYAYPIGSRLVARVFNQLKRDGYLHVDLLKPEIAVSLPLTLSLWPDNTWERLKTAVPLLVRQGFKNAATSAMRLFKGTEQVFGALKPDEPPATDEELVMASLLAPLLSETEPDERLAKWLRAIDSGRPGALPTGDVFGAVDETASMLLRAIARHGAQGDPFDLHGPDDISPKFARYQARGADLLIAGHTHLARVHEQTGGFYINTGTWADVMRLPSNLAPADIAAAMLCMRPQDTPPESMPFWQRPFRRLTYVEIDLTGPRPWSAALHQWPEEPRPALVQLP
jgi:UDP-2,3-diacylglucosamine pyrophosphatase LpxH